MPLKPGLKTLFAGLSAERMLNDHWPLRAVWRDGPVSRFGPLNELSDAATVAEHAARAGVRARALFLGRQNDLNEIDIEPSKAFSMYDAGATVSFAAVHRWHPAVAEWTRALATELQMPLAMAGCNLYISPAGRGLPMHFDNHEGMFVQLVGSKQWRIAENRTVRFPGSNSSRELPSHVQSYASGPAPAKMPKGPTVNLKPGSALFLPRGWWHTTNAKEPSISLSFGFRVPSWVEVLRDELVSVLMKDEKWREPAWALWAEGGPADQTQARWAQLREGLAEKVRAIQASDLAR